MILFCKLVLTILITATSQTVSQNVIFELMDSEFNEVIFVGEKDIVLSCSITCVTDAVITITHGDSVEAKSGTNDDYLQYNIEYVSLEHGGRYVCNVKYTDMTTQQNITILETLSLNVQQAVGKPQCFRNGTEGEPYQVGDILLMSCYCVENDDCIWRASIEGAGLSLGALELYESMLHRGKKIQRIKEEYTISTNSSTRYDCIRGQMFCSIGPEVSSSGDTIFNSVLSNNEGSREQVDCDLFPTTTYVSKAESANPPMTTQNPVIPATTPKSTENGVFLIVGLAVGIGICMLLVLVIVCIVLVLGKRNKTKGTSKHDGSESGMYSNAAFDGHDSMKDDPSLKNHNSKSNEISDYDLPPLGKVHTGKQTVHDIQTDVDQSKNRQMSYESPPYADAEYSYTEQNGFSTATKASLSASQNGYTSATREDEPAARDYDNEVEHSYSQVRKNGRIFNEGYIHDPDVEQDEYEPDFSKLYASVNKETKKLSKDAIEKNEETNYGSDDLYAEINKSK